MWLIAWLNQAPALSASTLVALLLAGVIALACWLWPVESSPHAFQMDRETGERVCPEVDDARRDA